MDESTEYEDIHSLLYMEMIKDNKESHTTKTRERKATLMRARDCNT